MIEKIVRKIRFILIKRCSYFNVRVYMKYYVKYLQRCGVNIPDYDGHSFISADAKLDGASYKLLTIGQAVTISTDVRMLVHDYSISRGLKVADPKYDENNRYRFMKPIVIGDGAFIGAGI